MINPIYQENEIPPNTASNENEIPSDTTPNKKELLPDTIPNKKEIPPDTMSNRNNIPQEKRLYNFNIKLYNELLKYPDGLTTEYILNKFNISTQKLYNAIYSIKKSKGVDIANKDGRYIIIDNNNVDQKLPVVLDQEKPVNNNDIAKDLLKLLPNELKNELQFIPQSDINTILDMLKKAYYYQKSAKTLIEANILFNKAMDNIEL